MTHEFAVVLFGATLAAIVSGSSGFAFGLIASAIWLHVLAPTQVVPLVVVCSMLVNLLMAWQLRGLVKLALLWPFLAGAMIGIPIGVAALHSLDAHLVRQGIGALLVIYSVYMLIRPKMPVIRLGVASGRVADGAVGMLGGFMGGATSLNGVFPTLWCGLRGWTKSEQRGVFQSYILIVHVMTLAWLASAGELNLNMGWNVVLLMPALLIGSWIGLRLFHRISEKSYRVLILGLFLVSGLILLQ
jgi:uncharacterized membrane protein YfcA